MPHGQDALGLNNQNTTKEITEKKEALHLEGLRYQEIVEN